MIVMHDYVERQEAGSTKIYCGVEDMAVWLEE